MVPLFRVTRPAPPPVEVDFVRVMAIGALAWASALVVALLLVFVGKTTWIPVAVSATGAALGLVGIRWARRHQPTDQPER